MTERESPSVPGGSPPISWNWVLIGVVAGALLLASLIPIVRDLPPRPDVAILVGALTFALMGVLVAFKSPGATVREAALSGIVLALLTFVGIRFIEDVSVAPALSAMGFAAAILLSAVGGWAGEVLQGTYRSTSTEGLQWAWIAVGTVLGVMLSVYAVFVPAGLWGFGGLGILACFSASFLVTAFFVGFFSPGITILEPALAAVLTIVIDGGLAALGFSAPFPLPVIVLGMLWVFLVALAGGYFGEVLHNVYFGAAWGDEEGVFREAPKPSV